MEFSQSYERKYTQSEVDTLFTQLQEQNKQFCNVFVQVGPWVRRLHSCVLKESGFFNTIFSTEKFREHSIGVIEIRERRLDIVSAAIVFLYGVNPKIDVYSIWEFFDIAEFLMIPRLKAFCVNWLDETQKTNTLIASHLSICTLYDVDIPSVIAYIRKNLIELMNGDGLLNIDTDSVQYLLSDKHLSYVSMEVKFRFLLRWLNFDFFNRYETFERMCALIDFLRLSEGIITAAKQDPWISLLEVISNCEYVERCEEFRKYVAIVAKCKGTDEDKETISIYDEIENEWYRLNVTRITSIGRNKYFTNTNDKSTFYRVHESSHNDTTLDLFSFDGRIIDHRNIKVQQYEDQVERLSNEGFDSICINGRTCVAIRFLTVEIENQNKTLNDYEANQENDESFETDETVTMQLLVGFIETNSDALVLYPMFSMKMDDEFLISMKDDCLIDAISMNDDGNVAIIIPWCSTAFIYNIHMCLLAQIRDIYVTEDAKMLACQSGFAIPDICDITLIKENLDISDIHNFKTVIVDDFKCSHDKKMFVIDDIFYRYQYHSCTESYSLDMTIIDDIERTESCTSVTWKQLNSPELNIEHIISVIELNLPKYVDRCHLQCPHCESVPKGRKRCFYDEDMCIVPHCSNYQSYILSDEQNDYQSDSLSDEQSDYQSNSLSDEQSESESDDIFDGEESDSS